MEREQIIEFINVHNVGADRGVGLILAFEAFAEKIRQEEKAKREIKFSDVYYGGN